MSRVWTRLAAALLLACGAASASAFVLFGDKWPNGSVVINLQLGPSGLLSDGSPSWDASAETALAAWNQVIDRVQFTAVRGSAAPIGDENGVNNVFFSNDIYGMPFSEGTIAITSNLFRGTTRLESDVVFNAALKWDSYFGKLRTGVPEFHRVAMHEFGHIVGLAHPDESGQTQPSLMDSHISNIAALTSDDIAGAQALYGGSRPGFGSGTVSFPPRNESYDFRIALEGKYRDGLKRSGSSTSVDIEGDIVWTQEYLRYRVNQCSHAGAIARVMSEIDGAPTPDVCGASPVGQVPFPPRNESFEFRNELEAKYRDGLGRSGSLTSVDVEGDIVWTQEYLRYRVNGCGHAVAVQSVFVQIDGFAAPPVCR